MSEACAVGDSPDLGAAFRAVRAATEALAQPLSAEDCAVQSMEDASPTKWHLAHTSWYFETFVLENAVAGYRHFDPAFRVLFNSYYNGVGDQYARPRRGLLSRPSLDEVMAYRRHVDRHLATLLDKGRDLDASVREVIWIGVHHEQQHQELVLTDLKHLLSMNPTHPVYRERPEGEEVSGGGAPPLRWLPHAEGLYEIGHGGDGFSFDNERPVHRVFLHAFEIASRPVTSGEYLAFMEQGGYAEPEHWLADGWATVRQRGWQAPLYWERDGDGWKQQTLAGLREIDPDEPVCHLSHYEADAYARSVGARLPGEAEWEIAAREAPVRGNFAERGRLHPAPARPTPGEGDLLQAFGDVWEWTGSPYVPYPGFVPPAGALGEYNGKFMSNQMVLRGGSCATPASHIRPSYRNFFYPDARWQFSGVRLARDA